MAQLTPCSVFSATIIFISAMSIFSLVSPSLDVNPDEILFESHTRTCLQQFLQKAGDLQDCTINIAVNNDNPISKRTVFDNSFTYDLTVLFGDKVTFIIYDLTKGIITIPLNNKLNQIFMFQFEDLIELERYINASADQEMWRSDSIFLIVSKVVIERDDLADVVKLLASKNILNSVLFVPSEAPNLIMVYSWYPFAGFDCANKFHTSVIVGFCTSGKLELARNVSKRIARRFRGCVLRASLLDWPPYTSNPIDLENVGIETRIIQIVAEQFELTLKMRLSKTGQYWGTVYKNGTSTGMLNKLSTRRYDVIAGAYGATSERFKYFHLSAPYGMEQAVWVVPFNKANAAWRLVVDAYGWTTFLFLCASCLIYGLLLSQLSSFETHESACYKSIQSCVFAIFTVSFGVPLNVPPRTVKVRFFAVLYMLTSVVQNARFSSTLTSSMTNPYAVDQISSVTGIVNKQLRILLAENYERYVINEEDLSYQSRYLIQHWTRCPVVIECIKQVACEGDIAIAMARLPAEYMVEILVKDNLPVVHIMRRNIASYSTHIITRKNYYLNEPIDKLIGLMTASGIVMKEYDSVHALIKKYGSGRPSLRQNLLTMKHLGTAFVLLGIGVILATVVFFIELYLYSRRK